MIALLTGSQAFERFDLICEVNCIGEETVFSGDGAELFGASLKAGVTKFGCLASLKSGVTKFWLRLRPVWPGSFEACVACRPV